MVRHTRPYESVFEPVPYRAPITSDRTHGLVTQEEETTSEKVRETGLGPDSGQVRVTTFVTTWRDMAACDTISISAPRRAGSF